MLWLIKGLGPGGAERLLVSTARVADHSRFQYEAAFIVPVKNAFREPLEHEGVLTHSLGEEPSGSALWPLRLRRLLARQRYDIVHVHSPLPAAATRVLASTLPRAGRPAVVSTEHNEWGAFDPATRLVNALTGYRDAHTWAVSSRVRDSMRFPVPHDVEVLVHGIELDQGPSLSPEERRLVRRELGVPPDAVLACTVANLREQKDYPSVLAAARTALSAVPSLYWIAVGQGPLEAAMSQMKDRLGLGDRFQFLGYRNDVAQILRASDLFVLGSVHEGYPVALMEAVSAGLPCVVTDVGGNPDAVLNGVNGIVVPPTDPQSLAEAVIELVTNPRLRSSMAKRAQRLGPRFDIRRAVDRQESVYQSLAEPSRR